MTSLAPVETSPATITSRKIRVMVVDDSAVVRGLVSRWVDEDPGLETVGRFSNGQLALNGIIGAAPDVVILDIEMPVMDGMTALPELLRLKPGVKIIIASTLSRKNAEISLNALALGATDYIPKPETNRGITTSQEFRSELLRKVKAMMPARARALRRGERVAGKLKTPTPSAAAAPADTAATYQLRPFSSVTPKILTIDNSTGGPQALAKVIKAISPATANIPTVITQQRRQRQRLRFRVLQPAH